MKLFFIFLTYSIFFSSNTFSNTDVDVVPVGKATLEKTYLFLDTKNCSCDDVISVFNDDINLYKKYFSFEKDEAASSIKVIIKKIVSEQSGEEAGSDEKATFSGFKLELFKKDAASPFFEETLSLAKEQSHRWLGHELAGKVFSAITKKEHIFHSKITFVSDKDENGKKTKFKQIYISDFDGYNTKRITNVEGHLLSPAVSYNGRLLTYSLINPATKEGNVQLRIVDLETGKDEVLSNLSGINSGAVFLPGDKSLVLTLSHSGNAEIYRLDLGTRKITPITNHWAADVDPSVSMKGDKLVFLSSRPGRPMIYAMSLTGVEKSVRRISFVGDFNATPRFSPLGEDIVFSSWLDNKFDLFKISFDGKNLYRLTKDFGSNEDPSFSPDGELIAFTSQRVFGEKEEKKLLYIMDKDGEVLPKLDNLKGKCQSPRWHKSM
jgi:TolB protein